MFLTEFAQMYFRSGPGMRHVHDGYEPLRLVGPMVFFVLVLVGMWLAYKAFSKSHAASAPRDPMEIAKERFAKGEISKDELAEIKKELKS